MKIEDVPPEIRCQIEKECLAKLVLSQGAGRPGIGKDLVNNVFFARYVSPVLSVGLIAAIIIIILKLWAYGYALSSNNYALPQNTCNP